KYFNGDDLPSPLSKLLPIDSEHSAIFQCMCGHSSNKVKKIFLTCSGGPFRTWSKTDIFNARPKDALKHPKWNMGAKITIDSASLFNKALEVIEAKWLFNIDQNDIDVLIHPQSIVHSMVGFEDGGIIAQLGEPSMKLPILYSLTYPERLNCDINFPNLSNLEFYEPDLDKFESLKIVRECLKKDDASCLIMNAANEVAVDAFLKEKITFGNITNAVKQVLNEIETLPVNSIDEILYADNLARQKTINYISKLEGAN
ncbi:MAG: 1-deoxy-D-xylulose-5-phosphate reductoisomerase, partial [Christensenellaceae bacterium]|nr:1-deoxy-D-xylulose-5-phosphate reductoisomerase [Christensenellaceae bacterium]